MSKKPIPTTLEDQAITELVGELTVAEKVKLLTGADFWSLWPIEKIGLRKIVVSDGPSGVRGAVWDERDPSINLPSASALSSSWDPDVARRYAAVAAVEARRKGIDVVLGPTINLHRSPLGGRHFEAFSEDPLLTGELAVAYVGGLQDNGVGANPKHYVANDFETDRMTADVIVDERTLHELYLAPFEAAVIEGRAWTIMSSYNSVNGATMSENDLLEDPLRTRWGFDGVVISDWTAVRSLHSAEAEQDLVMPGPDSPWGDALVEAVENGSIDEAVIDRKVSRLLLLAARIGALEGFEPPVSPAPIDGVSFAREAEIEGTVLVANDGILPLDPGSVSSIAVIGHNAVQARTQGGGSATVVPEAVINPLQGITDRFADADVTYALGAVVQEGVAEFAPDSMVNPVTGGPGARVSFVNAAGETFFTEDRFAGQLVYLGGDAPVAEVATIVFETRWTPDVTGEVPIGCSALGTTRVWIDGKPVGEARAEFDSNDPAEGLLAPPSASVPVSIVAGRPVDVRIENERVAITGINAMSATFGAEPPATDAEELIAEAVRAAAAAEVAVVVVGTNSRVESEGYDRSSLALPGRQDDLVAAVIEANPRTVVVVNSGSPVTLPWRDDAAAVALTWFGGQQYGEALADVLSGDAEPGGRLPTTWPGTQADVPVINVTPADGKVPYDEGINIGYRAWLAAGTEPAYPFGHGLGYTTWELGSATAERGDGAITLTVPVANTGDRAGKTVVQVYAQRPDSTIERPVRWLVGSAVVRAEAGSSTTATVTVADRALSHWDNGWQLESGTFEFRAGTSSADADLAAPVSVKVG